MNKRFLFTSESVSAGHPDKICDQLSDLLLDHYLIHDPKARVAIETAVTKDTVILMGEVSSPTILSMAEREALVRAHLRKIGYEQDGFHWRTVRIYDYIHSQSPDIAQGVVQQDPKLMGAGDQGLMFGYACNETPEYMPAPLAYAHLLLETIFIDLDKRHITGLGPDAKSQITFEYEGHKAVSVKDIVISIQHRVYLKSEDIQELLMSYVQTIFGRLLAPDVRVHINPTGQFIIGGPVGDTGLTGRKIIVDTYGGAAPHGGGAFSGKDPSKVDRSGAYMARYLAKNCVAAGLAEKCLIQLAYCIGKAEPVSLMVQTYGTSQVPEEILIKAIKACIDLTPYGIGQHLQLFKPIYLQTATYGHFGRKPEAKGAFSWEKLDLVQPLLSFIKSQ